jgi:hypothetical protein
MVTLNGGFTHPKDSAKYTTQEDRDMVAEFIRTKGVKQCPPAEAQGSESSPNTHERIMDKRKEYRANQRALKKAGAQTK